jgi:hypothetical protein
MLNCMKKLAFVFLFLTSCKTTSDKITTEQMISINDAMKIYIIAWTDGAISATSHIKQFNSWGKEEQSLKRSFDSLKFREAIFNR